MLYARDARGRALSPPSELENWAPQGRCVLLRAGSHATRGRRIADRMAESFDFAVWLGESAGGKVLPDFLQETLHATDSI